MSKRFFNDRVHNTKRTITNFIIIGVCLIGIIMCFILTSSFKGNDKSKETGSLNIKSDVTIEVNENFKNDIFFTEVKNVKVDELTFNYPDDYDISKTGTYKIGIIVDGKEYYSNLKVVDTTKPTLVTKDVTITEGSTYNVNNFVDSCKDNSGKDCKITFYDLATDEEANIIDFSKYTKVGKYEIKVSAKDNSDNQTIETATLTITKKGETIKEEPKNCKYGNNTYDTNNFLVAIDVTNNGCAISLDLYKNKTYTTDINKLMETETTRIQKDINALNLKGTISLNRSITAVTNITGDGVVGYELFMSISLSQTNKEASVIAQYKVDKQGNRIFTVNPYNLKK